MSDFEILTVESAPEGSRPLLQGLREQVGFIPNLAAAMAASPTLLESFLTLRAIAGRGTLDPVSREAVAVAVARETRSTYCVAAHSTFALAQGAPAALVDGLRGGTDPADERLRALVRFTRALVSRRDDLDACIRQLARLGIAGGRAARRRGRHRGADAGRARPPCDARAPRPRVRAAGLGGRLSPRRPSIRPP